MAKYFSRTNVSKGLPRPPIGPLVGGQLMKGARAGSVHRAQDTVVGLSARIVARQSLAGDAWLVANTDPEDPAPATRTYPDATTWRTVMRPNVELTPGCCLRLGVTALPSGHTQQSDGAAGFESSGAFGKVRASLTWTDADGGTDTTTNEVSISASTQQYAATRTGEWEAWPDACFQRSALIYPDDTLSDITVLRKWSRPPINVTGTIDHLGGARPIDVVLYEVPLAQAMEVDDTSDEWVAHFWDLGPGNFVAGPPRWPREYNVAGPDGDPRGIHHLMDVHHAQALRLGPMIFSWSAWRESDADVTAIAEAYASNSSTTFLHLTDKNITAWSADAPGWAMGCGGYARRQLDNGEFVYRNGAGSPMIASIPILVRTYGYVEAGSSGGTLRLQTAAHNYAECTITRTSAGWDSHVCHLRCGLNPEQQVIAVPLWKSLTASKYVRLLYAQAYYCATEPAA